MKPIVGIPLGIPYMSGICEDRLVPCGWSVCGCITGRHKSLSLSLSLSLEATAGYHAAVAQGHSEDKVVLQDLCTSL